MGFLDKVKDLLSKNADKVDTAIDKAGDVVDQKTQGKHAQHVDKVGTPPEAVQEQSRPRSTWPNCPSPSTFRCRRRRPGRAPLTCPGTRNG